MSGDGAHEHVSAVLNFADHIGKVEEVAEGRVKRVPVPAGNEVACELAIETERPRLLRSTEQASEEQRAHFLFLSLGDSMSLEITCRWTCRIDSTCATVISPFSHATQIRMHVRRTAWKPIRTSQLQPSSFSISSRIISCSGSASATAVRRNVALTFTWTYPDLCGLSFELFQHLERMRRFEQGSEVDEVRGRDSVARLEREGMAGCEESRIVSATKGTLRCGGEGHTQDEEVIFGFLVPVKDRQSGDGRSPVQLFPCRCTQAFFAQENDPDSRLLVACDPDTRRQLPLRSLQLGVVLEHPVPSGSGAHQACRREREGDEARSKR